MDIVETQARSTATQHKRAARAPTRGNNQRDTGSPHGTAKAAHRVYQATSVAQEATASDAQARARVLTRSEARSNAARRKTAREESTCAVECSKHAIVAQAESTRETRAHAKALTLSKAVVVRATKGQVAREERKSRY